MAEVYGGTILMPGRDDSSDLEAVPNAAVVVDELGNIDYAGAIKRTSDDVQTFIYGSLARKEQYGGVPGGVPYLIVPGAANTHCHTFQPPAIPGSLMEQDAEGNFDGWLPTTLKFETDVRLNPEKARAVARAKFKMYIDSGITSSLEYTTSSYEAARLVLEVAKEMRLSRGIKVGYVCMDQGVDFIDGVNLQASVEDSLGETEKLLKEFPGQVVVIDRFPIAVSSPLRKGLVKLAKEYGVLYETHFDESQGEAGIHEGIYDGKSIFQVLLDDGVFDPGNKVGLAHAIHTSPQVINLIGEKIDAGCKVYIRACPNSNAQLGSHIWDGNHVAFPLTEWLNSGAIVTLGLDKGAGRGVNIFGEALYERGRTHTDGFVPSNLDLLRMATTHGIASLGIDPSIGLRSGKPASFVAIDVSSYKAFYPKLPTDAESLAGIALEFGQDSSNVGVVWENGKILKK